MLRDLLAVLIVLVPFACAAPRPFEEPPPVETEDPSVRARLERITVNIDLDETPLVMVTESLAAQSGVPVVVLPEVRDRGLRVTLRADAIRVADALDLIALTKELTWWGRGGVAVLGPHRSAPGEMVLDLYDVKDVTVPIRSFPGEDINLTPPRPLDKEWRRAFADLNPARVPQTREVVFPKEWLDVQANRRPFLNDVGEDFRGLGNSGDGIVRGEGQLKTRAAGDQTVRLSNFIAPDLILKPATKERSSQRSRLSSNRVRITVGEDDALPLDSFTADVRVDGFRARVVLDVVFTNDRDRQLEGTFQLRLPEGASPYYLAFGEAVLDLSPAVPAGAASPEALLETRRESFETIRVARMVRRERAAHAYDETTRRRVDPALMEWVGAGVFNCRVFPLMPGKPHRIVMAYDVDLVPEAGDLTLDLPLPEEAKKRSATVTVADGLDADVMTEGAVAVRVREPGVLLLTGEDAAVGTCFATAFTPELPAAPAGGSGRAVFLVDVSLSSDLSLWLSLLDRVLAENPDSMREFAVLFFNVESFWWRRGFAENTPENRAKVRAFGETLAREGATDLAGACARAAELDLPHDIFLLSDGAHTFGPEGAPPRPEGAVFAYRTGRAGTDVRCLHALARDSGGAVFSVACESDIATAATAHRSRPWRLDAVTVDGGRDVLIAGRPRFLYPGQRLVLAGRGAPPPGAEVVLAVSRDGEERTVRVRPTTRIESDAAPRIYGGIAVRQMETLGREGRDPAGPYATHFRVVGDTCSLLMLESESDYRRFGITDEEDAARVRDEPADLTIRGLLSKRQERKEDRREALLAALRDLESVPGMSFELTPELVRLVRSLSEEALEMPRPGLHCVARYRDQVPADWLGAVSKGNVDRRVAEAEARRRLRAHGPDDALKALSALVEESPGDLVIGRDVAFLSLSWQRPAVAAALLMRAIDARPFEPEARRLLALCLEAADRADLARVHYEVLLATDWNMRHGDTRRIAAADYYRLLCRLERERVTGAAARRRALEEEFGFTPFGMVVTLSWSVDRTDVDLHVIDPGGEACSYQNTETEFGGRISGDVTEAFGPEMFRLERPVAGEYAVRAHEYSTNESRTRQATRVLAVIREEWATPAERTTVRVLPVSGVTEFTDIARVIVR